MPDILISEAIAGSALETLQQQFEIVHDPDLWLFPERLQSQISQFRALIVRNQTQVTREVLEAGTSLQVIGRAGVGLDNIDLEAAEAAGISVVYAPDQNANAVAELTLGLMLSLARSIIPADRHAKSGGWDRQRFVGSELSGKVLGLIGLGRIGQRVAHKGKALGMAIIASDPYLSPTAPVLEQIDAPLLTLDELLRLADFVSCHLPETHETRHLLNYDRLGQMKPTAFLLNTARGGIVDEVGLLKALQDKIIAGAAIDVREPEPPNPHSSFATLDNVILTPHIGAFTREAQENVVAVVCRDVAAILQGEPALYPVALGKRI